mgnify:FL=1
MKNRYWFFKKLYKDYVIILDDKGINKSYYYDKLLMKYISNNDINYIIVYNDFDIKKVSYKVNNYRRYLIIEFLVKLINTCFK